MDENENPTVSLSEEETEIFQRLLRASRRDIRKVEFTEDSVSIDAFLLGAVTVPRDRAAAMTDEDWVLFFAEKYPL